MKILIVEDDKALNNGIKLSLNENNILQAFCLKEAKDLISDTDFDLIILDINLPDGNGIDLCIEIRKKSLIPIIILTANDMEIDIVTGLESGADDYITKPFSLAVLRARVNAVLRRKQNNVNVFRLGKYNFDFENMKFYIDDTPIELSKTEQRLLKIFVHNIGNTLSRDMLLESVWDCKAEFVDENALSVTVKRLRKKLPDIPIKTIYGIGYVWEK